MPMRLMITGGSGMLARDIAEQAMAAGHDCVPLTRAELDITELPEVHGAVADAAPDVVINCAAWTDVDGAESAPEAAAAVNAEGAGNVAHVARAAGAWTVQVSTDYVFDGLGREPYVESDQPNPLSVYGRTKLTGEQAVAEAAGERHTIVRSSWLFGAHGRCFPATILRLAGERDEISVVEDQVGCPTFTGHLASALIEVCETRPEGILHVAGGGSCSWFELAKQIVSLSGLDCEIKPSTTAEQNRPAPRPAYSVLATERPGDAPALPPWHQGLADYMRVGLRS